MDKEYEAVLARKRERLFKNSTLTGHGLEIGPLSRPLVLKKDYSVKYVDHCSTNELIAKYPNTDDHIAGIEEVDLVWVDKSLKEMNNNTLVDYLVASHVIEHVPDPVGWIEEVRDVLKEEGKLYLVIPDMRFTFDAFRGETPLQEFRDAYTEKRRRPNWRAIADHFVNVRKVDTWAIWDDYSLIHRSQPHHNFDELQLAMKNFQDGKYVDVHVSVFTPWSFFEFLILLECEYGMHFKLINFLTTQDHDLEFYVTLEKSKLKVENWNKVAQSSRISANWPKNVK
jgi:predicted SAM-dependent methyltransferase